MNKSEIPDLQSKLLEDVRHTWDTALILAQAYLGEARVEISKLGKRWTDWLTGNDLWSSEEIRKNTSGRTILPTTVLAKDHLAYIQPRDIEKFIFGINRVEQLTLKQASAYLEIGELDFKECLNSIGRGIASIENGQVVIDKDAWNKWGLRRRWAEKKGQDYQDKLFQSLGQPSTFEPIIEKPEVQVASEPTSVPSPVAASVTVESEIEDNNQTRAKSKRSGKRIKSVRLKDRYSLDSMTDDEILRYLEDNGSIGGEKIA